MKTLVIANQKGGVGKSTLAAHVAYAAAEQKKRVLMVDMDRQGSLSLTFTTQPEEVPSLKASELFETKSSPRAPRAVGERLALIAADPALAEVPRQSNDVVRHVAPALKHLAGDYDLCVIDTPPGLSTVLVGALAAADMVVTPMPVGLYELDGVAELFATINSIKRKLNPSLRKAKILLMKTNSRSKVEAQALERLREQFGEAILKDSLPERAAVRAAVMKREPIWHHPRGETHEKAASEWQRATKTILKEVFNG